MDGRVFRFHVTSPNFSLVPSGLAPPTITAISGYEVSVSWTPPSSPRGALVRYEVYFNSSTIGGGHSELVCNGTALACQAAVQPYTSYSAMVVFYNHVGSVTSSMINFLTLQEG